MTPDPEEPPFDYWNYRVCRKEIVETGEIAYYIVECYYKDDVPVAITHSSDHLISFREMLDDEGAIEELKDLIDKFQAAIEKPILDVEDF